MNINLPKDGIHQNINNPDNTCKCVLSKREDCYPTLVPVANDTMIIEQGCAQSLDEGNPVPITCFPKNDSKKNLNPKQDQLKENRKNVDRHYTTAFSVHFTSYQRRVACGDVSSLYLDKSFSFQGLDHLLLLMEDIMDYVQASCPTILFPQASFQHRSIKSGKTAPVFQEIDGEIITEFESSPEQKKGQALFAVITVYHRQNASMQGELRVLKRKVYFRSGLELIRLLHQALESKQEER